MEINLLPWRQRKRQQDAKRFIMLHTFSLLVASLSLIVLYLYSQSLANQELWRIQSLKGEITEIQQQKKQLQALKKIRNKIISYLTLMNNLQNSRILTVHLFDELTKVVPKRLYATKIIKKGNRIIFFGEAQSANDISQFMRKLEHDPWFQQPRLIEIKKGALPEKNPVNIFKVSFMLAFFTPLR